MDSLPRSAASSSARRSAPRPTLPPPPSSRLARRGRMSGASFRVSFQREAFVFEQLSVLLFVPIKEHAHLPWSREHFRIFDRRFVPDVIGSGRRVTLDDVELLAVKIAGAIEPGHIVEML